MLHNYTPTDTEMICKVSIDGEKEMNTVFVTELGDGPNPLEVLVLSPNC